MKERAITDCWILALAVLALLPFSLGQAPPLQEAQKALGGQVERAVRKAMGAQVYLAALTREKTGGTGRLHLLRKTPTGYVEVFRYPRRMGEEETSWLIDLGAGKQGKQRTLAFIALEGLRDLQLLDLNRDGLPEVYLEEVDCGNAGCGHDYLLHDARSKRTWRVMVWSPFYQPRPPRIALPQDLKDQAIRHFLERRLARQHGMGAPLTPEQEWWTRHGAFSEGKLRRIELHPRRYTPCPYDLTGRSYSIAARAKLGSLQLASVFKGPVVALEGDRNACFVVYAPPTANDWVQEIRVLSPRRVALVVREGEELVYFDPTGLTLSR
ncbi:hypothetical protein [Thermus scotoductus]|uniref:hypothetical protein n=1 Tax=Thermus scotoductus TaxID=37636 RepID=UPI000F80C011|nr:hypothetical protein [Thermus scotoductus]